MEGYAREGVSLPIGEGLRRSQRPANRPSGARPRKVQSPLRERKQHLGGALRRPGRRACWACGQTCLAQPRVPHAANEVTRRRLTALLRIPATKLRRGKEGEALWLRQPAAGASTQAQAMASGREAESLSGDREIGQVLRVRRKLGRHLRSRLAFLGLCLLVSSKSGCLWIVLAQEVGDELQTADAALHQLYVAGIDVSLSVSELRHPAGRPDPKRAFPHHGGSAPPPSLAAWACQFPLWQDSALCLLASDTGVRPLVGLLMWRGPLWAWTRCQTSGSAGR